MTPEFRRRVIASLVNGGLPRPDLKMLYAINERIYDDCPELYADGMSHAAFLSEMVVCHYNLAEFRRSSLDVLVPVITDGINRIRLSIREEGVFKPHVFVSTRHYWPDPETYEPLIVLSSTFSLV